MLLLVAAAAAVPADARAGYRVPSDNPFVGKPGARSEIYVYGLRNPYRWSFDHRTGAMIIGDVGGGQREEITFLPRGSIAGANLGWNCFEGTAVLAGCKPRNYVPPSHQYRGGPDVVIGGHVVRDPALPSFIGRYLYGRYQSGIYSLGPRASGRAVDTGVEVESLTSLTLDGVGHLYATSYDGPVYRLAEERGALELRPIGEFARPVAVAAPPGDAERLFVVEKRGRVMVRTGGLVSGFLDLTARVRETGYEQGLLALAAAPDYATSGRVFAYYTDDAGDLQLDEYKRTAVGPDRADESTRRPLLTIRHDRSDSHNGGQLLFGRDGYLYLSTGDGDLRGDPDGDAQSLRSLLGKILRLDVGPGAAVPGDGAPPGLSTVANRRQPVLARGVVAHVRCSETCSVRAAGRLRVAGRSYRMRPVVRTAWAGRRERVKVPLGASARRALKRALRRGRRPSVRLTLRARDASGNRSPLAASAVRVRR
jgi:glucose/arabinose dehydrogenase